MSLNSNTDSLKKVFARLNMKAIGFVIGNYPYYKEKTIFAAEEGMTWLDWVNSSYNTGNFVCRSFTDDVTTSGRLLKNDTTGYSVLGSEIIQHAGDYFINISGGSD